jgi:hypothetical protein
VLVHHDCIRYAAAVGERLQEAAGNRMYSSEAHMQVYFRDGNRTRTLKNEPN